MTSTIPGATAGSGIRQTFNGNAGDTLTMYWNFIATDYSPFNDTAFAVLTTPDGTATVRKLAAIVDGAEANVASYNSTGWAAFTYTLAAAGEYAIGFGVIDHTDTALNPFLFVR